MSETVAAARCREQVAHLCERVEAALAALALPAEPASLYEPVRYVLDGGGKRLRPVILLLSAQVYGAPVERALPAALAVEVFHNFTLVHDDIMDHAASRRGRPTVHRRWDEATAILCGDYLFALAYSLLFRTEGVDPLLLHDVFGRMVARLCEGQALDKAFETQDDVSVEAYLHMIDGKTGALLEAVLELGGLIGGAGEDQRATLREVGQNLGRAFQIQDDLLDLVAPDPRWGKRIGGDLIEGKKTYLLLLALERARGEDRAWFERIVREGGLPAEAIPEARARMERLEVLASTRQAVASYTATALEALAHVPAGPALDTLRWLFQQMQARLH